MARIPPWAAVSLHVAAYQGYFTQLETLLDIYDVDTLDLEDKTPLFRAKIGKRYDVICHLVACGSKDDNFVTFMMRNMLYLFLSVVRP